jgi:hypothetical protein
VRVSEAQERPPRSPAGFGGAPTWVNDRPKRPRPKGSRRGIRGRKRGF